MIMKQIVCRKDEFGPGERRVVTKGKTPIVVVCNKDNEYFAFHGICPHQGAELKGGELTWLTYSDEQWVYQVEKEGEILRCPWHSFDYDVKTGQCVTACNKMRVKTYSTHIEDGNVVVEI